MTLEKEILTVTDFGESGLLDRIKRFVGTENPSDVILGIGDDCAAIRVSKTQAWVATCDMLYEEVHFQREQDEDSAESVGRRAVSVNLSDLAAMGATPRFALLSLGFPKNYPVAQFERMYFGMTERLREFGAVVIGGNLTNSGQRIVLDVFLLGEAHPDKILTRNGAKPGDRIFVTGNIGSSAVGLRMNRKYILDHVPAYLHYFVRAHNEPTPRIEFGKRLAESGFVTSCIDISDGLAADLGHLCEQSNCGARLNYDMIPRHPSLGGAILAINQYYKGLTEEEMVLYGGEDYELLFTVHPGPAIHKLETLAAECDVPIKEIGLVLHPEAGMLLADANGDRPLEARGWDHFRRGNG